MENYEGSTNSGETSIISSESKKYTKIHKNNKENLIRFVKNDGMSIKEAANKLGIKYASARYIVSKAEKNNSISNNQILKLGAPKKLNTNTLHLIERIVEENPTCTLKNMQTILSERYNIHICKSTVANALSILHITLKKATIIIDRVNSPETINKRAIYASNFNILSPANKDLCIFIDETGFNYHLRREFSRSKKGSRAAVYVPTVRGRIKSLIVAASKVGIIHFKIITNGTCNGDTFSDFVGELIRKLDNDPAYKGSWLIMDNAKIHKVQGVKNLVSASSYLLNFLSPYSYMLNPVERIFSKLKLLVRSELASNFNSRINIEIENVIQNQLQKITPTDCTNYVFEMMKNISFAIERRPFED